MNTELGLTVREAAQLLSIQPETLRGWIRASQCQSSWTGAPRGLGSSPVLGLVSGPFRFVVSLGDSLALH